MYFGQTRPMEVYDRQIRYLDYMENGLRTQGAGFVKLERQDNVCSISLQVSGLYRKDRFSRPLLLLDEQGERELCKLQFADGGIKLYLDRLDCNNLDGHGLRYEQLRGFRIPISEGKEIRCILEKCVRRLEKSLTVKQEEQFVETENERSETMQEMRQTETSQIEVPQTEMQTELARKPMISSDFIPLQELAPKVEISRIDSREEVAEVTAMKDDKWEQLWEIYPHKCPFSDEREYLALGPGDFVVLSERNFKLVNNSFLLHGYYNHHHLILTRIRERNRTCYYIGVPGNFYEREKRTAVMFGFKSFECAVEPAEEGDFGYYMIPVEL